MLVFRLSLIITVGYALSETSVVTHRIVYIRNLNLSDVSVSLLLPIRHVTRRPFEIQLTTLYPRRLAVYSQRGKYQTVHTRSENVKGCVTAVLYSCIRLYKYERGRSRCLPTHIIQGSGSLLPVVILCDRIV